MAVGKGRTRRLTIDGRRFCWRCDFSEPLEKFSVRYARQEGRRRTDNLVVRPEIGPHRLLTVSWPACHGPVVKPRLVRVCVAEALRRGWLSEYPALTLAASDVSVPQ
jgi:hypothetical protein